MKYFFYDDTMLSVGDLKIPISNQKHFSLRGTSSEEGGEALNFEQQNVEKSKSPEAHRLRDESKGSAWISRNLG